MQAKTEAVKVLIAGGGTGGHIYIGVAVAREILRRDSRAECVFVGTKTGLESRLVPEEGFRLETIDSAGLKRVSAGAFARGLFLLPLSLAQSLRLVRRSAPDAAVGVGGFSSGPVIAAAWMRGVPTLVVEPNAYPGLANRWLARIVDVAAVALPEALAHFRGKGVVTGIPVRREFHDLKRHALNAALCSALPELASLGPELRIVHQTGEKEWEMVEQAYRGAGVKAEVRPYLPRIYEELAEADLVLARAGASTLAELTVAGRAALLVPFPAAADDHQTRNAAALQRAGAARMIPERELGAARLVRELRFFLGHPEELRRMEEAARRLALPDAAARIVDLVMELARRERK